MNVLVENTLKRMTAIVVACIATVFIVGCSTSSGGTAAPDNKAATAQPAASSSQNSGSAAASGTNSAAELNKAIAENDANAAKAFEKSYRLGPGDRLRVIVFGEEDLSGEFEVDSVGIVSLPLIKSINTSGMTLAQLRGQIETQLEAGYLVEPRVSVEILNYRPFYITGEVGRPGEYPYVAGMNVLKAIAMAGGYTYRANTRRVLLTRSDTTNEEEQKATQNLLILPGDYIRVPERFF